MGRSLQPELELDPEDNNQDVAEEPDNSGNSAEASGTGVHGEQLPHPEHGPVVLKPSPPSWPLEVRPCPTPRPLSMYPNNTEPLMNGPRPPAYLQLQEEQMPEGTKPKLPPCVDDPKKCKNCDGSTF